MLGVPTPGACKYLFGNRAFADVVKWRWDRWVGLDPIGPVSLQEDGHLLTDVHWGMTMWRHRRKEALWRQRQGLELRGHKPRNTWGSEKLEEARKDPCPVASEGAQLHQCLDFGLLPSRTVKQQISVPVWGTPFQQAWKTNIQVLRFFLFFLMQYYWVPTAYWTPSWALELRPKDKKHVKDPSLLVSFYAHSIMSQALSPSVPTPRDHSHPSLLSGLCPFPQLSEG